MSPKASGKFRPLTLETMEDRHLMTASLIDGRIRIDADSKGAIASIENYSFTRNGLYIEAGYRVVEDGKSTLFRDSQLTDKHVVFQGSPARDTFFNNSSLRATIFGGAGDDTLYGSDHPSGGDAIWGGADNDIIYGRGGNDFLSGEEGSDTIYGGNGNDDLWGGIGNDTLFGGAGDDKLYGNGGIDDLQGDGENDLLFGGVNDGQDTLRGGAGVDRLLSGADLSVGGFYMLEDRLVDRSWEDAAPVFLDGYQTIFDNQFYTAQDWSESDVLRTDVVLELLQREAHGIRLLQDAGHRDLVFVRHGTQNRGFNNGWIHTTNQNLQFGGSDTDLRGYLLHEIGHNWQGNAFTSSGKNYWEDFKSVSGWTSTNPNNPIIYRYSNNEFHGDRWYFSWATFASDYARTNEAEDFAETFAAYFTRKAGWTFYNNGAGAAAIPVKIAIIDQWMAGL